MSLKDKFAAAMEVKNNDINTFIWKGPKEDIGGQKIQKEVRLIDASQEQLQNFYNHCMSMLYSKDSVNPGRFTLIEMLQEDREKCNTELFLRFLENKYLIDPNRAKYLRFQYLQDTKKWLSRNAGEIPPSSYYDTPIGSVIDNVPEEFSRLSVGMVMDGCLDKLDRIHKKPITLNFILSLGVWFEPEEMKDLTERDPETGKTRERLEVVKERLGLRNSVHLKIDPKGLNYAELRQMLKLRNSRFSDLTTDQLVILRNKILFRLEDEAASHAELWLEQIRRIKLVAEAKGYTIEEKETQC